MTGKELIELIRENNAEELQIMLVDEDGGMANWHYVPTELVIGTVDKNDKHFTGFNGNEKVAILY